MNKSNSHKCMKIAEKHGNFHRQLTTEKSTNTTSDLAECKQCKEREAVFFNITHATGDSKDCDLVNNYVKAINYINTCHNIINEMNKKLSCNMNMPDLPNFLAIYSSLLNNNSDAQTSDHKSLISKESSSGLIQERLNNNIDSVEELYARCMQGRTHGQANEENFLKLITSRDFKLKKEQPIPAVGEEICPLVDSRSKHTNLVPETNQPVEFNNYNLNQNVHESRSDTDDSEGDYEPRRFSSTYSKEQLENYDNHSDADTLENNDMFEDNFNEDVNNDHCDRESKPQSRITKTKIPALLRKFRKPNEKSSEQINNKQKGCRGTETIVMLNATTISHQELDKYAKALLDNDSSTQSSPRRDPIERNHQKDHKTQNVGAGLRSRSHSRDNSSDRIPKAKISNMKVKSSEIPKISTPQASITSKTQMKKSVHYESISPLPGSLPNLNYSDFENQLMEEKSQQRLPKKTNTETKCQNHYINEEYSVKNDMHSRNLPQRSLTATKQQSHPRTTGKTRQVNKSTSKSPTRRSPAIRLPKKEETTSPATVAAQLRKLPKRPSTANQTSNNNLSYTVESKPNDFFTESRSSNIKIRTQKTNVRRSASGSIIISDKDESEHVYTDSDIDDDHFQNIVPHDGFISLSNKRKYYK